MFTLPAFSISGSAIVLNFDSSLSNLLNADSSIFQCLRCNGWSPRSGPRRTTSSSSSNCKWEKNIVVNAGYSPNSWSVIAHYCFVATETKTIVESKVEVQLLPEIVFLYTETEWTRMEKWHAKARNVWKWNRATSILKAHIFSPFRGLILLATSFITYSSRKTHLYPSFFLTHALTLFLIFS